MRFHQSIKRLIILSLPILFVAVSLPLQIVDAERGSSLYSLHSTYAENAIRPPVGQLSLKITVSEDGIYELTKDMLRTAGFSVDTLDPNLIRMMHNGESVSYQFWNDDEDNVFDDEETVRFYGWAFDGSRYEQFFSDKNVYWIWFDTSVNGDRLLSESNLPSANGTDVVQFPESLYIEKNRLFNTPALQLDEFGGFEADGWFWARYGQRYHGRYVSLFQLFIGTNDTVELKGTAGKNATVIVKSHSLELTRDAALGTVVRTTQANGSGDWSIDIQNAPSGDNGLRQQTSYEVTVEADDGGEVVLDEDLLADSDTITFQPITKFFDKKRYFLDIPYPAPVDEMGTFVAEFMTDKMGTYTTTAELAGGSGTLNLSNTDYGGAVGEFINRDLQNGENTLVISGENVVDSLGTQEMFSAFSLGGFTKDRIWFNGITIDYIRLLMVDDNELKFQYDVVGEYNFWVSGFAENNPDNMIVWDVSDRLKPVHVELQSSDRKTASLSHQWRIGKQIVDGESAEIFATVRTNVRSVGLDQLETYTGVDIDPADRAGAEWVAISHRNFMESAESLASYRGRTSGLTTHVVDVEHIINQYGFGYNTPEAIRNYMIHAYRDREAWNKAPHYLLLVGDSDWNLLDRYCSQCPIWDETEQTFVVADYQFIDPYTGMNTTDHRYAMLDGDDVIPDIAVGRIPVKTSEEVDIILAKMQVYERAIYNQDSWVSNMLFLADDQDGGGNFCAGVNNMRNLISANAPSVYQFETQCFDEYLVGETVLSEAKKRFRTIMYNSVNNDGIGIVNYRGHGSIDNWGKGLQNLDLNTDTGKEHLEEWQNHRRPTVIISADCLDTEFGRSALPSLAETLLKHADGGSVAHFGSTGLGLDTDHTILMDGFYGGITQDDPIHTIGDAAVNAKKYYISEKQSRDSGYDDLTDITVWNETLAFTVLGDPALTIPTSNPNPFPNAPSTPDTSINQDWENVADPRMLWFLPSIQGGY